MNYQLSFEDLESMSGYCQCTGLSQLFTLKRRAESLEELCDSFRSSVNLERPSPDDTQTLLAYGQTAEKFKSAVEEYYTELGRLKDAAKLRTENHEINGKKYASINCASCGQQIDVVA